MRSRKIVIYSILTLLCALFLIPDSGFAEGLPVFSLKVQDIGSHGEYTVSLHVDNAQDIFGFEAAVSYNADMTEFISNRSGAVYEGFSISPKVEEGIFRVAFSRMGGNEPIRGDADLYYCKLKAKKTGTDELVLETIKVVDSAGNAKVYAVGSKISVVYKTVGGDTSNNPGAVGEWIIIMDPVPVGGPVPENILDISDKVQISAIEDRTAVTSVSAEILAEIQAGLKNGESVFIRIGEGSGGRTLSAPMEVFANLMEKQSQVIADYGGLQLRIPGGALNLNQLRKATGLDTISNLLVNLRVNEIPLSVSISGMDADFAGKVFEIVMDVEAPNGKSIRVTSFMVPLELWIPEESNAEEFVRGTRNIYKIDTVPPTYCSTCYNGECYRAEINEPGQYAVLEYKGGFLDVESSSWAKDYIRVLAAKRIVAGVGSNLFESERNVTRAEFVKMIVEALNLKASETISSFSDVPFDKWYARYVETAVKAGIAKGIGHGKFDPDGTITREQMAVMAMNAYVYATGMTVSEISETYEGYFSDLSSASSWATESIKAANVKGIINGMPGGTFLPGGLSRRDQTAAVIVRLLEALDSL